MLKQMEHMKHCPFKVLKQNNRSDANKQLLCMSHAARSNTIRQRSLCKDDLSKGKANKCTKQLLLFSTPHNDKN